MEIAQFSLHSLGDTRTHPCEICTQKFETLAQKSDHIVTHFHQEFCDRCEQKLIRIGEHFYVLHGTITCMQKNVKSETLSSELELQQQMDSSAHDDFKEEAESEDFGQQYTHTQGDYLDTGDFECNDIAPNSVEETPSSSSTSKIENPNVDEVKPYRKLKGKSTRYECNECKKIFTRTDHLRVHVLEVHRPSEKPFECNECCVKFATKNRLNEHKKYRTVCNVCGKIFCTKKQQLLHQAEEHDYTETIVRSSKCHYTGCNEMVADCGWAEHMASKHSISREGKKRNQYECDICSKTYKTKAGLEFHMLSVHCPSSKKFKCKICGYATVSQKLLEKHQSKIHFEQRNFMCSVCGKTFRFNHQLKLHNYHHTGEKPFPCLFEGCSKSLRSPAQRIEHMRMHTGQKPFECSAENCNRRFAYNIDLKRHKFSAHGIYTKKYPCDMCNEIFPENMLLKKHMKKHENHF